MQYADEYDRAKWPATRWNVYECIEELYGGSLPKDTGDEAIFKESEQVLNQFEKRVAFQDASSNVEQSSCLISSMIFTTRETAIGVW